MLFINLVVCHFVLTCFLPSAVDIGRSSSFITDILKVHDDEQVSEIIASRQSSHPGSSVTLLTPKPEDTAGDKFTFDVEKVASVVSKSGLVESDQISPYKGVLSPIDWKSLLSSPRPTKGAMARDQSVIKRLSRQSSSVDRAVPQRPPLPRQESLVKTPRIEEDSVRLPPLAMDVNDDGSQVKV